MALVLAVEGGDGTGKTTLANSLKEICGYQGYRCQVIGKTIANSNQAVANITQLIREGKDTNSNSRLTPEADIYLRIAREYERVSLAQSSDADIVLFDRFVVSTMSWAYMADLHQRGIKQILINLATQVELKATIFCSCPFELAWERVMERARLDVQALSPKEKRGHEYNRNLFRYLKQEFDLGEITEERLELDTTDALVKNKSRLANFVLPMLERLQALHNT